MTNNDIINDPVFWSFFLTTTTAFIFGVIKILAKSKCKTCQFLGCKIERDVELEEKLDEIIEIKKESNI